MTKPTASHNVGMKGHIGLQIHPGKELLIRFKDIEVRRLGFPMATEIKLAPILSVQQPRFDITTKKSEDRVEVEVNGAATIFAVTSPSGIGGATINQKEGRWPENVVLRLWLGGLASLAISNGTVSLAASIPNNVERGQRLSITERNQTEPVEKGGSYWTEIRALDGTRRPRQRTRWQEWGISKSRCRKPY